MLTWGAAVRVRWISSICRSLMPRPRSESIGNCGLALPAVRMDAWLKSFVCVVQRFVRGDAQQEQPLVVQEVARVVGREQLVLLHEAADRVLPEVDDPAIDRRDDPVEPLVVHRDAAGHPQHVGGRTPPDLIRADADQLLPRGADHDHPRSVGTRRAPPSPGRRRPTPAPGASHRWGSRPDGRTCTGDASGRCTRPPAWRNRMKPGQPIAGWPCTRQRRVPPRG